MGVIIPAISLAPGQSTGRLHKVLSPSTQGPRRPLMDALKAAVQQLQSRTPQSQAEADSVETYLGFLSDPDFLDRAQRYRHQGLQPAEAIRRAAEDLAQPLELLADDYLREQAQAIRDAGSLWIEALWPPEGVKSLYPPQSIVWADVLTVREVARWNDQVVGAVLRQGSPTMHAAMLAQSLGVPVVAVKHAADWDLLQNWLDVTIDADQGWIAKADAVRGTSRTASSTPVTIGPEPLGVYANIGSVSEMTTARERGSEGVGLVRTELLFSAYPAIPTIDSQARLLAELFRMAPGPVMVRTLDLSPDSPLFPFAPEPTANGALGIRGSRVYRRRPDLLADHLTAIQRALKWAPAHLSLLFPMVASVDDWNFCADAWRVLGDNDQVALGCMLEVPALAFLLPDLARAGCQFVSLGTNDLIQYLAAVDRSRLTPEERLSELAVARALAYIIDAADAASLTVHCCGHLASQPHWARLLRTLGVKTLSVPVSRLAMIRDALQVPLPPARAARAALTELHEESFLDWLESL